jgi:hypothetical protein
MLAGVLFAAGSRCFNVRAAIQEPLSAAVRALVN